MSILIVEDDLEIANSIQKALDQNGLNSVHVTKGLEGLSAIKSKQFRLVILDLMLPDIDGLDLITKLREEKIKIPVLILSAKRHLDDRVQGLEKGGDDYMVKPFALVELIARINNLLKRATPETSSSTLTFLDLKIDLMSRETFRNTKKIDLQTKEFQLLELLIKNQNQVLSKAQILEKIWGYSFDPQTNVVDVLVYRLRNKIDKDFDKEYLHTIRGIGYVLKSD